MRRKTLTRIAFPGGLLYYDGDSDGASLNPALNAAMVAARYAPLASTSDKTTSYNVSGAVIVTHLEETSLTLGLCIRISLLSSSTTQWAKTR